MPSIVPGVPGAPGSPLVSDADLAAHEADATSIHGIADTSDLALRSRLVLNVKNYGALGDGTTDDSAAIVTALAAAAGQTLFFPKGTYVIARSSYLPDITATSSALVGDPGGGSTLRFTHASGGLSIGDGVTQRHRIHLKDITLDGFSVCNIPLRIRKSDEHLFDALSIQLAVTAAMTADNVSWNADKLLITTSPIGVQLTGTGAPGLMTFTNTTFYDLPVGVKVASTGFGVLNFQHCWFEEVDTLVDVNASGLSVSWGRVEVSSSRYLHTAAAARMFYTTAYAALAGEVHFHDLFISAATSTTPLIDLTGVNLTSGTIKFRNHDWNIDLAALGSEKVIHTHASQAWNYILVDMERINSSNVTTDDWATTAKSNGNVFMASKLIHQWGNPEGTVPAPIGWLCSRLDTGKLYVKESGEMTNTGWVVK